MTNLHTPTKADEAASELLACPFCGINLTRNQNSADLMVRRYGTHFDHPENLCFLSGSEVSPANVDDWNRRAPSPADRAASARAHALAEEAKTAWGRQDPKRLWNAIEALEALAQQQASPTPQAVEVPGYVLVPREPTPDMEVAGEREFFVYPGRSRSDWAAICGAAYRAMIAAATPPTTQGAQALAVAELFAIADEMHGELDKQTYDEKRRGDWDLPDDYEFSVTITARQERILSRAIIACEKLAALPVGREPT